MWSYHSLCIFSVSLLRHLPPSHVPRLCSGLAKGATLTGCPLLPSAVAGENGEEESATLWCHLWILNWKWWHFPLHNCKWRCNVVAHILFPLSKAFWEYVLRHMKTKNKLIDTEYRDGSCHHGLPTLNNDLLRLSEKAFTSSNSLPGNPPPLLPFCFSCQLLRLTRGNRVCMPSGL